MYDLDIPAQAQEDIENYHASGMIPFVKIALPRILPT